MKTSKFILIFVVFTQFLTAQEFFKPGLLITKDNDTITGVFAFKFDEFSDCIYYKKTTISTDTLVYNASNSKYCIVGNAILVPTKLLENNTERNLLLTSLVSGKVNLYYYLDYQLMVHYFVEKEGVGLRELRDDRIVKYDEERRSNVLAGPKRYIGELAYMFTDGNINSSELNETEFNKFSLSSIVLKYNNAQDSKNKAITHKNKGNVYIGIYAGAAINAKDDANYDNSTIHNIGVNLNYFPSSSFGRYSFEIGYEKLFGSAKYLPSNERKKITFLSIPLLVNRYYNFKQYNLSYCTGIEAYIIGKDYYKSNFMHFRPSLVLGGGLDYDLQKFRITTNIRFHDFFQFMTLTAGISF